MDDRELDQRLNLLEQHLDVLLSLDNLEYNKKTGNYDKIQEDEETPNPHLQGQQKTEE